MEDDRNKGDVGDTRDCRRTDQIGTSLAETKNGGSGSSAANAENGAVRRLSDGAPVIGYSLIQVLRW